MRSNVVLKSNNLTVFEVYFNLIGHDDKLTIALVEDGKLFLLRRSSCGSTSKVNYWNELNPNKTVRAFKESICDNSNHIGIELPMLVDSNTNIYRLLSQQYHILSNYVSRIAIVSYSEC